MTSLFMMSSSLSCPALSQPAFLRHCCTASTSAPTPLLPPCTKTIHVLALRLCCCCRVPPIRCSRKQRPGSFWLTCCKSKAGEHSATCDTVTPSPTIQHDLGLQTHSHNPDNTTACCSQTYAHSLLSSTSMVGFSHIRRVVCWQIICGAPYKHKACMLAHAAGFRHCSRCRTVPVVSYASQDHSQAASSSMTQQLVRPAGWLTLRLQL
jgi:hypothetical protein